MKKTIRRLTTLFMALLLVAGLPLNALAAEHEAGSFEDLSNAVNNDTDSSVSIKVTSDIDFGGNSVTTKENTSYTIGSDSGKQLNNASFDGSGSVEISTGLGGDTGLTTSGDVSVTVTGDVTGSYEGIAAGGNSTVTVEGDVTGGSAGIAADGNSTVTVEGDVTGDANGIFAHGDSTVDVTGDVTGNNHRGINAFGESTVTVEGDVTSGLAGIEAGDYSAVTVEGDITGGEDGILAFSNSTVDVTGDVTGTDYNGIFAALESTVTVEGDVTGGDFGIFAYDNSTVAVDGNVSGGDGDPDAVDYFDPEDYSDGGDGIYAVGEAQVEVTGNATGGNGYGTYSYGGNGVEAWGSAKVTVGGNATGGSVTADPDTAAEPDCESRGGSGVTMDNTATVVIGGNATGSSTNGDSGYGGDGVYITVGDSELPAGSLTVKGSATGSGAPANGIAGSGIYVDKYTASPLTEQVFPRILVGSYSSLGASDDDTLAVLEALAEAIGVSVADLRLYTKNADMFWNSLLKEIRNAKKGDTITADAGARTLMPAYIMDAVREYEIILVIQWDGGEDIVIEKAYDGDKVYTQFKLAELSDLLKG